MAATTRSDCGGVFVTSITLDLDAFAANDSIDVAVTSNDIKADDVIISVIPPAALDDDVIVTSSRVTGAGAASIRLANVGGGTPDPASGVFQLVICRR